MQRAVDSSINVPTSNIALAARAAGVSKWMGYIGTKPNLGLQHIWTQADFENARLCGTTPIAFCSGNDDPVALRDLARAWNVVLFLDDEPEIRPYGSWEQPFLDAAGSGLYGLLEVHTRLRTWGRIVANYPGFDPLATWPNNPPPEPHGWQWQGTHTEFGLSVDSSWLDDSLGAAMAISFPAKDEAESFVDFLYGALLHREPASDQDREGWVNIAMTSGLWGLVDQFVGNVDVVAEQAVVNQLIADYKAGKLGSTAPATPILVPHSHPGGQTGPAQAS